MDDDAGAVEFVRDVQRPCEVGEFGVGVGLEPAVGRGFAEFTATKIAARDHAGAEVDEACGGTVQQQAVQFGGELETGEVAECECCLDAVDGLPPLGVEPADVVDEHVEPVVGGPDA